MSSQPDTWGVAPADLKRLADYFAAEDLEFRVGATNSDKTKGMALVYVTNRAIMDRLDAVCGLDNWRNEYRATANDPTGESITCGLSILVARPNGTAEWITKWDGSQNSAQDPVKGGMSGAMKRAAVQWGIGRYLYSMPNQWVAVQRAGNSVRMIERPRVPKEWLPGGAKADAEVANDAHEFDQREGTRPRDMTPEQRGEIEALIAHPAMPKDAAQKYRGWLRTRQSYIMAGRAIDRLGQLIVENGGVLDDSVIGGDGHQADLAL